MKIGFDAKRAFVNPSGLGNYSRTLIDSLSKYYPGEEYILFSPECSTLYSPGLKTVTPGTIAGKLFPSYWRSYSCVNDMNREAVEIYHGLSNELPFSISESKAKKITTVHDLIFMRHPEWYPAIDSYFYKKKFRHACRASDVIIAVSRQTKKDIEEFFGTDTNKIKVIYQSCNPAFAQEYPEEEKLRVKKKYNLPGEFILYVGTIEERKNLLAVIRALPQLSGISLVAAGEKKQRYFSKVSEEISRLNLVKRIIFPSKVDSHDLPILYRLAKVFVYPSLYEGFGIPVLEAISSGVPVAASRRASIPEAGGANSLYFDPLNAEELVHKIKSLLDDSGLRKEMAEQGKIHAANFSPQIISRQLMELYKSMK